METLIWVYQPPHCSSPHLGDIISGHIVKLTVSVASTSVSAPPDAGPGGKYKVYIPALLFICLTKLNLCDIRQKVVNFNHQ